MSYQKQLKEHLAEYKREHLGISEAGIFRFRGRDVLHDHILPEEYKFKNLFDEAAPKAREFLEANPRRRHRYFHHLNSSQAFAFNLFFPFFSGDQESASALLRALGQEGKLEAWKPEWIPDADEGTNIDVWWKTADGTQTFCEVKLSEADFGKAKSDERHHSKYDSLYSEVLKAHLSAENLEPNAFFAAYQFNRNLWHLVKTERSILVFLLPRANSGLWRQLTSLQRAVVGDSQARIAVVAIEDVIGALSADLNCPARLRAYAKDKLAAKYLLRGKLPPR